MKGKVSRLARVLPIRSESRLEVSAVCTEHGRFMWTTLHRLGVPPADLPDAVQDVLVVVHRRGHTFDGSCRLTTWLFAVCAKVAAAHRRRAPVRREQLREVVEPVDGRDPEQVVLMRAAAARLRCVLDGLTAEQRVAFVMFEIEGFSCSEIAKQLGVPLGTVHSRLHAARKGFRASLERLKARERHQQNRRRARGGR